MSARTYSQKHLISARNAIESAFRKMTIFTSAFRRLFPKKSAVTLGSEGNPELLDRLRHVVESSGGTMRETFRGVGGSQEVCIYRIRLPGGRLTAIAETYEGLSLRGPDELVRRIAAAVSNVSREA